MTIDEKCPKCGSEIEEGYGLMGGGIGGYQVCVRAFGDTLDKCDWMQKEQDTEGMEPVGVDAEEK